MMFLTHTPKKRIGVLCSCVCSCFYMFARGLPKPVVGAAACRMQTTRNFEFEARGMYLFDIVSLRWKDPFN